MSYNISSGRDNSKGEKLVIYGVEGVGKTTLAASLPDPIFIDTEGGSAKYDFIKRFDPPKDWNDLQNMVTWFSIEQPGKTLVIDTFDWAEMAEVADMLKEHNWKSIESAGYGKGYTLSAERIGAFLNQLTNELINQGMNVALLCHSQIKKIELPDEQGSFDKYELKLGKKTQSQTAPLVKEWADTILFCNYKTYVESKGEGSNQYKATGGTERVIYTTHSAVWDAKNRCGLPDEIPMEPKYLAQIFAKSSKKTNAEKTDKSVKPSPKTSNKAKKTPEKELKPEKEVLKEKEQTTTPISEDNIFPDIDLKDHMPTDLMIPDGVPEKVREFCAERSIHAQVIQLMLFTEGIVKTNDFNLEKVPKKFWKSFMEEYASRWASKIEEARNLDVPF